MNKKIVLNLLCFIFVSMFFLFGISLFSGKHFCYLPVEDKGPGTFGCFYSAGSNDTVK